MVMSISSHYSGLYNSVWQVSGAGSASSSTSSAVTAIPYRKSDDDQEGGLFAALTSALSSIGITLGTSSTSETRATSSTTSSTDSTSDTSSSNAKEAVATFLHTLMDTLHSIGASSHSSSLSDNPMKNDLSSLASFSTQGNLVNTAA
ncbi:hypothetical protein [Dickeya dianthicola]|uniref:hypothetical protein n=1 Tax=Dickeya dianthicola TaxID=204039 RepID=UPI00301A7985